MDHTREPCVDIGARMCPTLLFIKFATIFDKMTNLRKLEICGPQVAHGFSDELLTLAWRTTYNLDRRYVVFMPSSHYGYAHYHVISLIPLERIFHILLSAMPRKVLKLQEFSILGFTKTFWQSLLLRTHPLLMDLVKLQSVRRLTSLSLELDLFTHISSEALETVVKLIEDNPCLRNLGISAGPPDTSFKIANEYWSPMLDLLGRRAPFRLHTLRLDGLVTCNTTTLDRIVRQHSHTLRRLVLDHTNFRAPNSLRAFFIGLAETDINYFASRYFLCHNRSWLCGSTIYYSLKLPDEVLWNDGDSSTEMDESYLGWICVTWDVADCSDWIKYDNSDGRRGQEWMRDHFLSVVEQVDCGGISDNW